MTLEQRLDKIEALLVRLVECSQPRAWYTVAEFASMTCRSAFTCREWCRLGRVAAIKQYSGRGAHATWAISHEEFLRFQREGLLPAACDMQGGGGALSDNDE